MNLEKLKEPIPCNWKVQTANEYGCSLVAYLDARQVAELLDQVCGAENWQDKYEMVGPNLVCSIGIRVNGEWVYKSDTGTVSDIDGEKGHFSDAFKRAAVKWGVGRFLYDLPMVKTKSIQNGTDKKGKPKYVPVTEGGSKIWDCTEYVNNLNRRSSPQKQSAESQPAQANKTQPTSVTLPQETMAEQGDVQEKQLKQIKGKIWNICKNMGMSQSDLDESCLATIKVPLSDLTVELAKTLHTHVASLYETWESTLPGKEVAA